MKDDSLQLRAAYSPVNQAWFVILGRANAPIEQWKVTSVGDGMVWSGKKSGRRMLKEELTRLGLRFADDDPNLIVLGNTEDAERGEKDA